MKCTTFFLALIAVSAWSIFPGWAQGAQQTSAARVANELNETVMGAPGQPAANRSFQLAQMGGMMQGGQCGPGMGGYPQPGPQGPTSGGGLFSAYCASCHPGGGNNIIPGLPIRGSAQLRDFNTFRDFVRNPTLPNGARGAMPGFSPGQLPDPQMRQLYQFLQSRWGS